MMKAVLIRNTEGAGGDSDSDEEDSLRPSFITAVNEDVFSQTTNHSVVPDVRRNILSEINNMEATVVQPSLEKEFLQVYLRVKPITDEEIQIAKDGGYEQCDMVTIDSANDISLTAPIESKAFKSSGVSGKMTHHYTFSKIFKPVTDQKQIFSDIVMPRIKEFLEGRNQLLFTYGATGAGKTYTIQGTVNEPGVMPNSFQTIFKSIEGKMSSDIPLIPVGYNSMVPAQPDEMAAKARDRDSVFKLGQELDKVRGVSPTPSSNCSQLSQASSHMSQASSKGGSPSMDSLELSSQMQSLANSSTETSKLSINDENITYSVWISFAEIYNEQIHDLFQRVPLGKKKAGEKVKRPTLKLAQDRNGFTYIKDLTEFQVSTAEDAYRALSIGRQNLQFAATKLNQESSRSHCIFTVKIVRVADAKNPHLARVSLFSFCDLAGSERISKTQAEGVRLKEAGNINTSLLVLGRCIKAIRANQQCKTLKKQQQNIPPFRESKLTRLIKEYFVGQGKASLLVCLSQAPYLFDESLHVLKFAAIASKVSVEEFKAPEPIAPPPKKTRFSSMVAGGGVDRSVMSFGGGRDSTIQWMPSSRSTMLPHLSRGTSSMFASPSRSTMCNPVPRINITEADESMNDTAMEETTMIPAENYNKLVNIMEEMVEKLKAEKKRGRELELEIKNQETKLRSELCTDFNRLLVETEELYKDQLEKVAEREREYGQWRVDALMQEMEKRKKRKRESAEDDIEQTHEQQLTALEDKLQKEASEAASLRDQLEGATEVERALKETMAAAQNGRDRVQAKNSELQQQLAEQQKISEDLHKELSTAKDRLNSEQKLNEQKFECEESEISNLKLQISQLRSEMGEKDKECADMKELLQEAGDEFLAKQDEVDHLRSNVKEVENKLAHQGLVLGDVEGQLEESHVLLRELNDQMEDKEARVEELEESVEELKQMNKIKEERCTTAEKFIDELKKELEETKHELVKCSNDDSYKKILVLQSEKEELHSDKNKLLEQLANIKSGLAHSREIELSVECSELKNDLSENEKMTENLQKEISTLQEKNISLREDLSNYKLEVETLRNTNNIKECNEESWIVDKDDFALLKAERDQLEAAKHKLEKDLDESKKNADQVNANLAEALKKSDEARAELAEALKDADRAKKEVDSFREDHRMEKRFESVLETGEFELTEQLIQKEEQVEKFKTQFEKAVQEKDNLETECKDLQTHVDELNKERDDLNIQMNELRTDKDKISSELEEISKQCDELKQDQLKKGDAEATDQADLNAKLAIEKSRADELKNQLTAEKSSSTDLVNQLTAEKSSKIDLENELTTEKSLKTKLEQQLTTETSLKTDLEQELKLEKSSKSDLEKQLDEEKSSKTELEKQLNTETKRLTELESNLDQLNKEKENIEKELSKSEDSNNLLVSQVEQLKKSNKERLEGLEGELEAKNLEYKETVKRLNNDINELKVKQEQEQLTLKTDEKDHASEIKKLASERKELEDRICVLTDKLNEFDAKTDNTAKLIEVEGRVGGLEKEVATKETYIKELEDIMVEKEFRISELETLAEDLKETNKAKVVGSKADHETELLKSKQRCQQVEDQLEESAKKARSIETTLQQKVNLYEAQTNDYQKKINQFEKEKSSLSDRISNLENKLEKSKAEISSLEKKLSSSQKDEQSILKFTEDRKDLTVKLNDLEQENSDLKAEVSQLVRIQEEKTAAHDKELKRLKKASAMVIQEYRDTNFKLSKMTGKSLSPGAESAISISVTESSQLDADDSADSSLLQCTPVVRKTGRGRAGGRGGRNRTAAARLSSGQDHGASPEDSNTENESEQSKKKLTRKPRVAKSKNVSYQEAYPTDEPESAKKRVLRERQLGTSLNQSADKGSDSEFLLPPMSTNKKRRLYSTTPQVSAVFTPPTDTEGNGESPRSMVKRQLRSRRKKK